MSWFENLLPSRIRTEGGSKRNVPAGLWTKCPSCNAVLYRSEVERNLAVCPKCSHHMRIVARTRLEAFLDEEGREELGTKLLAADPLTFKDSKAYPDRLTAAKKSTGESDAAIAINGSVLDIPLVAVAFEFQFMGGSMGSVVGERFTCLLYTSDAADE